MAFMKQRSKIMRNLEKYKGVIWMGSVIMEPKTNTKYLEMKSILDSKLLT